ncbi:hypothetical protein [Streptomyces sp. NPDC005046]
MDPGGGGTTAVPDVPWSRLRTDASGHTRAYAGVGHGAFAEVGGCVDLGVRAGFGVRF